MKAIVIATKESRSLPVLLASINAYVPDDVVVYIAGHERWGIGRHIKCFPNMATNYGEAYNAIVNEAFKTYDEIIVANDDVVLTPTTYQLLAEDVTQFSRWSDPGWIVARSDYVRSSQISAYMEPGLVYPISQCSPLFGYVTKKAWVNYPPINWYSDDIQCLEMKSIGYQHYVSRAFVHHAGSQTIGMDNKQNHLDAEPWIKANKPELHRVWYETF